MTIHIQKARAYHFCYPLLRESPSSDVVRTPRSSSARRSLRSESGLVGLFVLFCCLLSDPMLLAQPQGAEGNTGATPNATVPPPGDQADHDRGLALARKAMDAGDYPKAIELLNLVVEGWPQDTAANNLLAQAKAANAQKGNYAAAMEAGRQSLNSGDYE